jgi:hypothetical protein
VLKPSLDDHTLPAKLKNIPATEPWLTIETIAKDNLANLLSDYLQKTDFNVTNNFNDDFE